MATSDAEDGRSRSGSPDDSGAEQGLEDMHDQHKEKGKSSNNAKDPSRPRRKKARRACYACQRAHLTCGDERPCQRCIKRGLQDACQDGVRKKAKYLHDAPNEALMPGVGGNAFNHPGVKRSSSSTQIETQTPQPTSATRPFFSTSPSFNMFPPSTQMPPPMLHERTISATSFPHQSSVNSNFGINHHGSLQSPPLGQDMNQNQMSNWSGLGGQMIDDPGVFNFDIASMNFGNHYGALEFGMLGQMATNAGDTPPSDAGTQRGSIHQTYRVPLGSMSESPNNGAFLYNDSLMGDWSNGQGVFNPMHHSSVPHAFAIESNTAHFASPDAHATPDAFKHEGSPLAHGSAAKSSMPEYPHNIHTSSPEKHNRQPATISTPQLKARSQLPAKNSKRPKDPSTIYTTVTSPHPYTAGFHSLIAYLQKRFSTSPSKTLAIAKSLASIRPSFIATTKTLNREDLIFMEKCFQRTLWEYEGFIEGVGTPTIVARRTGEVAAVGKEFQILTGWTKNVLLGRSPNLNVNRGHSGLTPAGSGADTGGRATGWNTPTQQRATFDENGERRPQPVFLAELLDDDSVVKFYDDFARLAFGDSRGSVMGKGKLLKYRTKDDEITQNLQAEADARNKKDGNMEDDMGGRNSIAGLSAGGGRSDLKRTDSAFALNKRHIELKKEGIAGEKGMQKLGSADGKVDCTYCWTVKRDVFDIPMLIVMNFLPCI